MRRAWLTLAVVVVTVASCGYPALPPVPTSDGGVGDSAPPTLELIAGGIGGAGNVDGSRDAARFNEPTGVAVGIDGTVYVADTANDAIRKVGPHGDVGGR